MSTHTQCGLCGHLVVDGVCLCPQGVATVPALRAQLIIALQSLLDERDRQAVGQALEERMRSDTSPDWNLRPWKVEPATLPTGPGPDLPDLTTAYEVWVPDDEGANFGWAGGDLDDARHYARQVEGCTIIRVTREVVE